VLKLQTNQILPTTENTKISVKKSHSLIKSSVRAYRSDKARLTHRKTSVSSVGSAADLNHTLETINSPEKRLNSSVAKSHKSSKTVALSNSAAIEANAQSHISSFIQQQTDRGAISPSKTIHLHTSKKTATARRNLKQVLTSFYMTNNAEVVRQAEIKVLERKGLVKTQQEIEEEEKNKLVSPPKGAPEYIEQSQIKEMVNETFGHLISKQTGISGFTTIRSANERYSPMNSLKRTLGVISCDKINEKFIKRTLKNHRDVDINNNKLHDNHSSFRAGIAIDEKYLQMRLKFRSDEKLRQKKAEKEAFEALAGKQQQREEQVPKNNRLQFLVFRHRYVRLADQELKLTKVYNYWRTLDKDKVAKVTIEGRIADMHRRVNARDYRLTYLINSSVASLHSSTSGRTWTASPSPTPHSTLSDTGETPSARTTAASESSGAAATCLGLRESTCSEWPSRRSRGCSRSCSRRRSSSKL